jgi:hypothetical protein
MLAAAGRHDPGPRYGHHRCYPSLKRMHSFAFGLCCCCCTSACPRTIKRFNHARASLTDNGTRRVVVAQAFSALSSTNTSRRIATRLDPSFSVGTSDSSTSAACGRRRKRRTTIGASSSRRVEDQIESSSLEAKERSSRVAGNIDKGRSDCESESESDND